MKDKFVTYHCENRIGFITMIRAEKRNALNPQLVEELKIAFSTAEKDEKCKVIDLIPVFQNYRSKNINWSTDLYFLNDEHFNEKGAYLMYKTVIDNLDK